MGCEVYLAVYIVNIESPPPKAPPQRSPEGKVEPCGRNKVKEIFPALVPPVGTKRPTHWDRLSHPLGLIERSIPDVLKKYLRYRKEAFAVYIKILCSPIFTAIYTHYLY